MSQPARATQRQTEVLLRLLAEAEATVAQGHPLDAFLAAELRAHREFGSRDRRLFSEALFACFRWKGALDEGGIQDPAARLVLAWQLDQRPPSPAIELLQSTLTGIADQAACLRALPAAALVPAWLRDALRYPEDADPGTHFEHVVRSFQQRPPTWLRCRRGQRDKVLRLCTEADGEPYAHARLPDALGLARAIPLDPLHRASGGAFEVQDVASQAVGLACDPQPGEAWWDVCAGAGGKSLHLADLMNNRGHILATDVREAALKELMRRSRDAGFRIIETSPITHAPMGSSLFDGVLVDAPCSGIGTWSRNPDLRWRTPSSWVKDKAVVQRSLLERAAPSVKPGGKLIYAVCTITRAETVGVLEGFAAAHPEFTSAAQQIWPWESPNDGMFIATLRRTGGASPSAVESPHPLA